MWYAIWQQRIKEAIASTPMPTEPMGLSNNAPKDVIDNFSSCVLTQADVYLEIVGGFLNVM